MFREVRRKKNEISREEIIDLLKSSRRGILAMNGDDSYPYAIPINYLYDEEDNKIYFHGSKSGHKIEALTENEKVCFTVVGKEDIKEEAWAPYVKSALVFGKCHFLDENSDAMKKLKEFAMKFYPTEAMVDEQIAMTGKATQVFEIEIEHMTGKEVQER